MEFLAFIFWLALFYIACLIAFLLALAVIYLAVCVVRVVGMYVLNIDDMRIVVNHEVAEAFRSAGRTVAKPFKRGVAWVRTRREMGRSTPDTQPAPSTDTPKPASWPAAQLA